jgi:uncharacterized membrane protein
MENFNEIESRIQNKDMDSKKSLIRTFFLNLLMIFFIVLGYFYTSESFGAISSFYIGDNTFSIQFSASLLLFSFLVILSGPYVGFISGFIGEFLVQLAIYNTVYLEWCITVAIFGFLCGYYRYKPLKYKNMKKIYFTFISLFLSSLLTTLLIILYQSILSSGQTLLSTIFINYGFKFLMQAIISTLVIVPILLRVYDTYLATKERQVYLEILTHHPSSEEGITHTFHLTFGRTNVYFCSRCSGAVLGGLFIIFFSKIFKGITGSGISAEFAIFLCIIAPIPGLMDWGTQRLQLRTSTTEFRLITGFVLGMALFSISLAYKYYFLVLFLLVFYLGIFFILMYFGHKTVMRQFKEESEQPTSDETEQ